MSLGIRRCELESWPWKFLPVEPWAGHLITLSFWLPIRKAWLWHPFHRPTAENIWKCSYTGSKSITLYNKRIFFEAYIFNICFRSGLVQVTFWITVPLQMQVFFFFKQLKQSLTWQVKQRCFPCFCEVLNVAFRVFNKENNGVPKLVLYVFTQQARTGFV